MFVCVGGGGGEEGMADAKIPEHLGPLEGRLGMVHQSIEEHAATCMARQGEHSHAWCCSREDDERLAVDAPLLWFPINPRPTQPPEPPFPRAPHPEEQEIQPELEVALDDRRLQVEGPQGKEQRAKEGEHCIRPGPRFGRGG